MLELRVTKTKDRKVYNNVSHTTLKLQKEFRKKGGFYQEGQGSKIPFSFGGG